MQSLSLFDFRCLHFKYEKQQTQYNRNAKSAWMSRRAERHTENKHTKQYEFSHFAELGVFRPTQSLQQRAVVSVVYTKLLPRRSLKWRRISADDPQPLSKNCSLDRDRRATASAGPGGLVYLQHRAICSWRCCLNASWMSFVHRCL